ncbi:YicC/YloC family endoribonuclease [Aestuariivirga sp.]|uniref:YicC/YloC family endoribonuclease n=1 Tax=Aestuariivirga sp. TaxID=2650926 RepID=UPI003593B0A5
MPISSMTGFARASSSRNGLLWQWEVKSVNGKALDVRCRLPMGFEALEAPLRAALTQAFRRGNLQVNLTVSGAVAGESVRLNTDVLDQLVAAGEALRDRIGGEPLRADALLALRGVVEVTAPIEDEAELEKRNAAMLKSFGDALASLAAARREEGARLQSVISAQIGRIAELTQAARDNPARSVEAIKTRLADQVARLMETGANFDPDRLHQEAVILATRADIQEELDRLQSHVEAAHALLASSDAIGRKFDFLAQEFNREANTLCSKASDRTLTAIGLDLKTVIDQMREQVQNIE